MGNQNNHVFVDSLIYSPTINKYNPKNKKRKKKILEYLINLHEQNYRKSVIGNIP